MKINISRYSSFFLYTMVIITALGCGHADSNAPIAKEEHKHVDENHSEVFEALRVQDSLLFGLGFNQCDTALLSRITHEDFEFYHDQSGVTDSHQSFVQSIVGLCKMDYKATRELVPNSLSVHILRNNGRIYGAIQNGKHRFYGEQDDKPKYLTSTAEFTHLWLLDDEVWKLSRVLSFDHRSPES